MSKLFDDASLAMIPSAYKDGRLYSIRPVPEYGSEVLSQPVDIDTDFIANSGGVIVDANTFTTAGGSTDGIIKNGLIQSNKRYRLEIQGTTTSSGFTIGNGQASGNEYGTGFGVHYFTSASTNLWIRQNTAGTTDITTFSIKEVLVNGDFTFSRGSNLAATRVDVNGLIEKGRENVLLQSNQFDTTWIPASASVTGGQAGYDGSNNAWLLEVTATGSYRRVYQSGINLDVNTFSIYAKANTSNFLFLLNNKSSTDAIAWFDLSDGSIGGVNGAIDTSIESVGNGWYRCSVTSVFADNQYFVSVADGIGDITGTTGASLYIQDAQLEQGLVATDYIETGASTAQAGILENMPRLDYSGGASCPSLLLEPQRTNLVEYSEYFQEWHTNSNVSFSTNEATSPEGLTNATKLTATSTSNSYVRDNLNAPAGNNVFSVFAKYEDCQYISLRSNFYTGGDEFEVWFDIQNGVKGGSTGDNVTYNIEDYGNDWYRCYAVFNIDAGDTSGYCYVYLSSTDESFNVVNGTGALLYGGQLEAGSYPTSYIPTYGTTQTRVIESSDLSSLQSNDIVEATDSYTIFFDISNDTGYVTAQGGNSQWLKCINSTSGNIWTLRKNDNTNQKNHSLYFNKAADYVFTNENINKACFVFTSNQIKIFIDGNAITTYNASVSPLDLNGVEITCGSAGRTSILFSQLLLFPTALTDSECIALTSI
jgi:hypothetical protein